MTFLAIVAWDQDNRVAKFQPYPTQAEAEAHVARFGGFVAEEPADSNFADWLVDPNARTLSVSQRPADPPPPKSDIEALTAALIRKGAITQDDIDDEKTRKP